MKRRLGIVAVAALSTLGFSQLASADSYDFWTANTPKQAETQAAAPKVAPVGSAAAFEEFNEVTAVAPKRVTGTAAQPRPAQSGTGAAAVSGESYNFWLERTPKRAAM